MKIITKLLICIIGCLLVLTSCQTVPITGRQQLSLIPRDTLLPMSFDAYSKFLSKNKVIENTSESAMVKRAGIRIQRAVEQYFSDQGMASRLTGYRWEFHLVEDKNVNAWAMAGGKVVVYSGMIPVARNETGLAVVLGHEIAHAVAAHGEERMSQGLVAQMGGMALSTALGSYPKQTADLFMTAYGLGSQVGVLLPYGRVQESEADHLGLIFMAMAGYDPREALSFWQRMSLQKEGGATPELLSSHPADTTRIRNIEKLIPEAMRYYRQHR